MSAAQSSDLDKLAPVRFLAYRSWKLAAANIRIPFTPAIPRSLPAPLEVDRDMLLILNPSKVTSHLGAKSPAQARQPRSPQSVRVKPDKGDFRVTGCAQ
jgi:hypothetical protein